MKKCVLITGAASGIGQATAREFAAHGYDLILTARREDRLKEVRDDLTATYQIEVQTFRFDIRDQKECASAMSHVTRPVDILINNAGLARGLDYIHEGKLDHWEEMIDTNLKGLLYMTRLISPGMVERKSGHIINLCSTAGKEIYPKGNVYCATKFAVEALTKAMRADLYTHGIRVSQVSPGHVEETEFARVRFDWDTQKASIYSDFNPLTSRDVAETIYFIASRPPHVNIQDILMMGTQQAGSTMVDRSGRKYDKNES
jgi:NADP-dependent 3-hydroxy acid dehydrogenase YdfG